MNDDQLILNLTKCVEDLMPGIGHCVIDISMLNRTLIAADKRLAPPEQIEQGKPVTLGDVLRKYCKEHGIPLSDIKMSDSADSTAYTDYQAMPIVEKGNVGKSWPDISKAKGCSCNPRFEEDLS